MKVLQIISDLRKGGAERITIDIVNEMQKGKDIKVKIIILQNNNSYQKDSKNLDIEYCRANISLSISKKAIIKIDNLIKIINNFKPDIIHTHLFAAEILSKTYSLNDIAYFSHFHDNMKQLKNFTVKTLFNKELFTNYYEKRYLLKQYNKVNQNFICISQDTFNYAKETLPQKFHKNIFLLPNAINFKKFEYTTSREINKNCINLVTVGSLQPKKNQIFLVDIVKMLKDKGYNVKLDILGDGQEKQNIQNKITELNLEQEITLCGNVDNVEDYLKQADIYVHPAYYEPFGLVLLEAMASGLPVVCLDAKGNRDIIENGKNGFILENHQDKELFASKIIELIENKEKYSQMSNYACQFAAKYDIKEYVDKLLELYKNAIK